MVLNHPLLILNIHVLFIIISYHIIHYYTILYFRNPDTTRVWLPSILPLNWAYYYGRYKTTDCTLEARFISPMSERKYTKRRSGHFPKFSFHFRSKRVCYTNPQNPSDFKGTHKYMWDTYGIQLISQHVRMGVSIHVFCFIRCQVESVMWDMSPNTLFFDRLCVAGPVLQTALSLIIS